MLEKNGILLYLTCTFSKEDVINEFISGNEGAHLKAIAS